jgi:two-component system sensor histidine kinase VicK
MPPHVPTTHGSESPKTEIAALRAEIQHLRQGQQAVADQQALADRYEQTQVRFRTVFDHSPLGHKIIDKSLTIRQANPAVVAMLGFTHTAELVGRTILEFAHPDHRADWDHLQQQLWTHQTEYFTLETRLIRQSGSAFWCEVTSVLFPDEAGELGYTTLIDVDGRKQLELHLKRLYDTQETILHLVAHDLKTPISHIQLLVDLLRRNVDRFDPSPAGDPSEDDKFLTLIGQACAEADNLLRDVLYLGELDAKPLAKRLTDLNAFLAKQLPVHRLAAQENGIALALELPPRPVLARVDPDKLGRVLDNLLTNALKFTPTGGQVTVHLEPWVGGVRLTVQDTGIGIPAAAQAHIFDKFGAAARAGLYGASTTGLGLFITQQIVRLHGGTIWLESQENEGTTFFVDLP